MQTREDHKAIKVELNSKPIFRDIISHPLSHFEELKYEAYNSLYNSIVGM